MLQESVSHDEQQLRQVAVGLADLVMERCDTLAACSEEPGRITRRFLTEPMERVHTLLSEWMCQAGLVPRVDHAGNLIGRRPGVGAHRVLLIGSHLDTVPGGGAYDGVLGVLLSLAVAEMLGDTPLPFHLDVIGFSEEEGVRFDLPYIGSSAVAGLFRPEWLARTDTAGTSLAEAITAFQLDPQRVEESTYDPATVLGYLEPHIEQGPVLELASTPIGVVTGIAGQSRLGVAFDGESAHAGTTPMEGRHDALVCAAKLVVATRTLGHETEGLRATVGRMTVSPNAPNVVPEHVELSLDIRHPLDPVRAQAVAQIIKAAQEIATQEGVAFTLHEDLPKGSVAVDPGLTDLLGQAIQETGHPLKQLPSGAGHDAVMMAEKFPVAMLFLRHPGGVSHHPDERVDQEDVAVGIEVLCHFLKLLAVRENSKR